MDAVEAAKRSAQAIGDLGGGFMMDGATYARGGELGLEGLDFYVLGRCGVLGDTTAGVAASGLNFWNPPHVAAMWDRARGVMSPSAAGAEWAAVAHAYGETHLPDGHDYDRFSELAARVCEQASPACAALFAGWMALPVPGTDRPKARAYHYINALRELRGGLHAGAVLAAGLTPLDAVAFRSPFMAGVFGWDPDSLPDGATVKERWKIAEAGTDAAMSRTLEVLDASERAELVSIIDGAHAAWTAAKEA